MNVLSSRFAGAGVLVVSSLIVGCSSDATSAPNNNAGSSPGGAASGGKSGSPGAGGAGAAAGGSSGGAGNGGGVAVGGSSGAGTAGAGPAVGGMPAAIDASFNTMKSVIESKCFGSGCHSEEGNPLQMEIDEKLYGTLTTYTTKMCGKLLNTASPADSAIIKLMMGDCNGTPRMPFQKCWEGDSPLENEACVPSETVAAIKQWIEKGAPQ